MLIVREKREQLFIMYLLKSNKIQVAKLHVFRAPKNSHVADVVRLPFGQFVDLTRTNVTFTLKHHVDCAREERTAFHSVCILAISCRACNCGATSKRVSFYCNTGSQ
jgi:hypothetical protein